MNLHDRQETFLFQNIVPMKPTNKQAPPPQLKTSVCAPLLPQPNTHQYHHQLPARPNLFRYVGTLGTLV